MLFYHEICNVILNKRKQNRFVTFTINIKRRFATAAGGG